MHTIFITDLCVKTRIGVSEKERSHKQPLLVSVEIEPEINCETFTDALAATIDYGSLRRDIKNISRSSECNLIEWFALTIARFIKEKYSVRSVTVTVKKFPYGDAAFVGTTVRLQDNKYET